jgi:flagellar assembly factor FliW
MEIKTTRFGTIQIDDSRIIRFKEGLPGFPNACRFVLLEHAPNNPFHWLQCLDDPTLAFVVMDPLLTNPDYANSLGDAALQELGIEKREDLAVLVIATIDRANQRVTVNLLGPLVIHAQSRHGKQVILADSEYSTKHDLTQMAIAQQAAS